MRLWSLRVARVFGVDIRLHAFLLVLLLLLISYSNVMGGGSGRNASLWFALLSAIAVREIARALAAAALGLDLRSLLLLPFGALPTFATAEATDRAMSPKAERVLALVGPLANLLAGLTLFGLISTAGPSIDLVHRPWLSPLHLLRAFTWMQFTLAGVHLIPAAPLDCGRLLRLSFDSGQGDLKSARAAAGLGQAIAAFMLLLGVLTANVWLVIFGATVLLSATTEANTALLRGDVETIRMRDVMLTDFITLSASETLEDALTRILHTLQDVFPVTRGPQLVGAITRQAILETLQSDGNGYLQAVMARNLAPVQPDDPLVQTLRRLVAGRTAQFVPVVEDGRVVGIVTPQNLSQSIGLFEQRRRLQRMNDARKNVNPLD